MLNYTDPDPADLCLMTINFDVEHYIEQLYQSLKHYYDVLVDIEFTMSIYDS